LVLRVRGELVGEDVRDTAESAAESAAVHVPAAVRDAAFATAATAAT